MAVIVGIDTGSKNIGIATYDIISNEIVCYPNQTCKILKDYFLTFQSFIQELDVSGDIEAICFEKPFFTAQTLTRNIPTLETIGIQKLVCQLEYLPIYEVSPKTVKKQLTGNGNASKQDVIDYLNDHFDLHLNDKNSHVADAAAIAYTFPKWRK